MIKSCKKVYELLVFAFGKFLSNLLIDNVRFSAKNVLGSWSLCVNLNNNVASVKLVLGVPPNSISPVTVNVDVISRFLPLINPSVA